MPGCIRLGSGARGRGQLHISPGWQLAGPTGVCLRPLPPLIRLQCGSKHTTNGSGAPECARERALASFPAARAEPTRQLLLLCGAASHLPSLPALSHSSQPVSFAKETLVYRRIHKAVPGTRHTEPPGAACAARPAVAPQLDAFAFLAVLPMSPVARLHRSQHGAHCRPHGHAWHHRYGW